MRTLHHAQRSFGSNALCNQRSAPVLEHCELRPELREVLLQAPFRSMVPCVWTRSQFAGAWTLIEMIAVLAILAIFAAVLLPVLVKEMDKSTADQERATLQSFADAFQQYVLTSRTVPDQNGWVSAITSRLGIGNNDVLYNAHQQAHQSSNARVFLIDPALALGAAGNGLPYAQTNYTASVANSPMMPAFPRLMIVSSLGKPLPNTVVSGVFSSGNPYFSHLWDSADGSLPNEAPWSGWGGNPTDVIVQRINLGPLFVHLLLTSYNSTNNGYYSIDSGPAIPVITVDGYVIQGSVVGLYHTNLSAVAVLDTQQILSKDSAFVFQNGVWRGNLSGGTAGAGVMDLADVVQQFLNAPPNVNAQFANGNAQQALVVNSMLNYMSNYNIWAAGSPPYSVGPMKGYLVTLQGQLMSAIQGLYQSSYFPTNPSACTQ